MKSAKSQNRFEEAPAARGALQPMADPATQARFAARLLQRGHSSLSCQAAFQTTLWTWWWTHEVVVPFRRGRSVWLALGPPVGPTSEVVAAIDAFCREARATGAHAAFFGLDAELARQTTLVSWACAEDPICFRSGWPADSPSHVPRLHLSRQSRRGARTVTVTPVEAGHVDAEGRPLLDAFIARQAMPPLGFAAQPSLRASPPGARHWLAHSPAGLEGALVALPNAARGTWLIEALFRRVGAPNGTSELLIDTAMRELGGAERVSLGMLALHGPVPWPLVLARSVGRSLYSFAGLASFRRRLLPDEVRVLTLAYPNDTGCVRAVWAVAMAFCHGRPLRFGVRMLVRGPRLVLWLQALALLVWTAGLAWLPWQWCFAHPVTQRLWVGFDAVLVVFLARLAFRPTRRLAGALAWVVATDVALTTTEMLYRSWPTSELDVLARLVTIGAPLVSAVVLRGTHRRLGRLERRAP